MTSIDYHPIDRSSAVESVERRLRRDILTGRWAPGDKLPPERELAAALGVNRLTLRGALGRLAAAGLLVSLQGDGNRVRDYRLHAGLERLPELAEAFMEDAAMVVRLAGDLLELRRLAAAEAVATAATRVTAADIAALRRLADEQRARIGDVGAFIEGDLAFMRAVLRHSGNLAFELAFNTVIRFGRVHADMLRLMYLAPAVNQLAYDLVIGLLEARDAEQARTQTRCLLEANDRAFLARLEARLNEERRP